MTTNPLAAPSPEDLTAELRERLRIAEEARDGFKRERDGLYVQLATARQDRDDAERCIKGLRIGYEQLKDAHDSAETTLEATQAALVKQSIWLDEMTVDRDNCRRSALQFMDERDEARRGLMATRRQLEDARTDFTTLADEMDELTKLAFQATRGLSDEERLMAASNIVARLVRPQRQRDAEDEVVERAERECMGVPF